MDMWQKSIAGFMAAALWCGAAAADVKQASADAMVIQIKAEVALDRDAAWARLLDISRWWNGEHTYSGSAESLSVDAVAGGCWCEFWDGGEVEHGRVIMVMPKQTLRFATALGPLQEMGVNGALTLTLSDGGSAGKTAITLDYKVTGGSLSGLDRIAPVVNQVLNEQVTRFAKGE
jgi:hypothetical protein